MPKIHTGPKWESLSRVMKATLHWWTVWWSGPGNIRLNTLEFAETVERVRITYAAGGSSTTLPSSSIRKTGRSWRFLQSLRTSRARSPMKPAAEDGAAMRLVPESTIAPQEGTQGLGVAKPGICSLVILTPQCTFPRTVSARKAELDSGRAWTFGPTESQPGAPRPRSRQRAKLLIPMAASMESASVSSALKPLGTWPGWPRPTMPEKCELRSQTAMSWLMTCQKGVLAAA
mmetsp:Transcript_85667/g.227592  ORF Transcript_85667/g.227592 Transcript_85667/m.227592 type:complete len:231 (+) Transcript_85667:317-1009(+)